MPLPCVPLMQGSSQKCRAARAAFRVRPAPQKPGAPAARSASHRRGQRVQASGTATEIGFGHNIQVLCERFAAQNYFRPYCYTIYDMESGNTMDRTSLQGPVRLRKDNVCDGGCHAHRKRGDLRSFEIPALLARDYPSQAAAASEIISTQALLKLPKGTEHFMSDLHGEK